MISEVENRRLGTVSFLLVLILIVSTVAWLIHCFTFIFGMENVKSPVNFYSSWGITTLTLVFISFMRLIISNKNLNICFSIVTVLLIVIGFQSMLSTGAGTLTPYMIFTIILLSAYIVWGTKRALILHAFLMLGILLVNFLHLQNIIQYHASSTITNIGESLIYIMLLGIIVYLARASSIQIEDSYKTAFEYAKKLEALNKELDNKVLLRTKQLEKSFETQVESISSVATIGRIAQAIIHDLKSAVSSLQGSVALVDSSTLSQENKESFELIKLSSEQILKIVSSSRDLMNNTNSEELFNPVESIHNIVNIIQSDLYKKRIKIQYDLKTVAKIKGSIALFERIITNLFVNAIEELSFLEKDEKLIKISSSIDNDQLLITVRDNGRGIDKKVIGFLFDNDFTTKKDSKHFGIGLYFVKSVMLQHFKGDITAESKKGKFTQFVLKFNVSKTN